MKPQWISAAIGALVGLGFTAAVQAAPVGVTRSATQAGDKAEVVTKTHGRHYRRHRHYHGYYYRPGYSYYYGSPYYYNWAPRRYYRPYYGYSGYRPYYGYYGYRPYYRPGFSIWF